MSDLLTLRMEKPIYGGACLARHEGRAIFVPFTLPEELVTAAVTKGKNSFAQAELVQVLEPAAARTSPPCPHFGVCGGCHYQHGTYAAQLTIKAAILAESLTRAHLTGLPEIKTHSGNPLGYRNRIRLHLDPETSALGYRERASHSLLAVHTCPIASPTLQHALAALAPLCAEQQAGEAFHEVELFENHDGSTLLLAFWPRPDGPQSEASTRLTRLCAALQQVVPALRGAGVHAPAGLPPATRTQTASRRPRRTARNSTSDGHADDSSSGSLIARWGESSLTYRAAGHDYHVSLGAFFQGNRHLIDTLVSLATDGQGGRVAWDLYAGVGLFSRVLAQRFDQVIAVEGAPISSKNLAESLASMPGSRNQAIRSSTLDFLHRQDPASSRGQKPASLPDLVLVDPPRAGLGPDVTTQLSRIRPPHITYVSCDPATLARDLHALVDSGYQLQQLHLIDLFPQTFHLEAVARLVLRRGQGG